MWLFKKGESVVRGERERYPSSCFAHPPVSWWLDRRGVARRILCLGCWKSPGTISNRALRLPFIIAMGPGNRVSNLWRNGASTFTKGFPGPPTWTPGTHPRAGYWSWTIWWRKVATTNGCWISLPNTRLIVTSLSCICVKICFPGQVCQNHFAQCPLRGGLQESARSTGDSQSDDASVSHVLAQRPLRVRRGDATFVWVLDVGFASGLRRSLPSVCRPLKRQRVDTDLHSSPSGLTHPNLSGMIDAPCNGC